MSLLALSDIAFAEGNCPDGMVPIPNGCMPTHDTVTAASAPAQPRGRWETRWGAIATDNVIGSFGAVTDFVSKRQAQKAAIVQCKTNGGGKTCKSSISYYNQCAVIAWGDDSNHVQGAETIKIASDIAIQKCSTRTANCKIVYSACSLPVWVE